MSDTKTEHVLRRALHAGNDVARAADPNGPYPKCKPGLGTACCERCGHAVGSVDGACPAVPLSMRWSMMRVNGDNETGDMYET